MMLLTMVREREEEKEKMKFFLLLFGVYVSVCALPNSHLHRFEILRKRAMQCIRFFVDLGGHEHHL